MNNFKMDKRQMLQRISRGLQWEIKPPKLKLSIYWSSWHLPLASRRGLPVRARRRITIDQFRILVIELEQACNGLSLMWGNIIKTRLMPFAFKKTPGISLCCKLVPDLYRGY